MEEIIIQLPIPIGKVRKATPEDFQVFIDIARKDLGWKLTYEKPNLTAFSNASDANATIRLMKVNSFFFSQIIHSPIRK